MICDHRCNILSVNAKFGGATHDSFIWENSSINSYIQSLHRHNEIVWLLDKGRILYYAKFLVTHQYLWIYPYNLTGDSGYPQRPWLMTPYLNPAHNSIEENYNALHISARVVIENTFGRLKNRWRCVHRDRTLHYQPEKCARIFIACCVLHNIAIKYNVPEPEETEITPGQSQETFDQQDTVIENEGVSDLLMGRALRGQLARRLNSRRT
ncbi:hypothetical protein evm_010106 [Chilo suppressalis]|nr:hypothetical protein evm_010106 [Chilo suppressalis]